MWKFLTPKYSALIFQSLIYKLEIWNVNTFFSKRGKGIKLVVGTLGYKLFDTDKFSNINKYQPELWVLSTLSDLSQ